MADEPLRHTKSEALKRIVRRRDRRRKPGANSGDKVYSWAEYSQVNFTPTGDRSAAGCAFTALMIAFAVLLLPAVLAIIRHFVEGPTGPGFVVHFFSALLGTLVFLGIAAIPCALIMFTYAKLDGNTTASRERLIETADKLRRARDDATNRGT